MSKKVKKTNTNEEVTANKVTESKVETTSIAPTETLTNIAPKKEEKSETKAAKEIKAVKAAAKKVLEKKSPAKTAIKEANARVEQIFVQYAGNEYATDSIIAKVKDAWVNAGHKYSSVKSLNLYVKPEENAAYYVINDKESGKIEL